MSGWRMPHLHVVRYTDMHGSVKGRGPKVLSAKDNSATIFSRQCQLFSRRRISKTRLWAFPEIAPLHKAVRASVRKELFGPRLCTGGIIQTRVFPPSFETADSGYNSNTIYCSSQSFKRFCNHGE